MLDNNISCLFYNQNNKKYLKLFKYNINQLKINKIIDIIEIDNGLFKFLTNSNDKNKIVSKNKNKKIFENYLVEPANDKLKKFIWHKRFLHYDIKYLQNKKHQCFIKNV